MTAVPDVRADPDVDPPGSAAPRPGDVDPVAAAGHWIGGRWTGTGTGSGATLPVEDPSTTRTIARVARGDAADVDAAVVAAADRPRPLAVVSTATTGGLVMLGTGAILAGGDGWRWIWVAIGTAAAVAAVVNLRWVPRLPPTVPDRADPRPVGGLLRAGAVAPLVYSSVYFIACVVYFTFVSDAAAGAGLGPAAGGAVFIVLGVTGLFALATGRFTARVGARRVGALSVGAIAVALALLAAFPDSLALVLLSAGIFGAAYLTGSAALAIWTAELHPDRPGTGFTVALAVGAGGSIVAPALVGGLRGVVTLSTLLLLTALGSLAYAAGLGRRG